MIAHVLERRHDAQIRAKARGDRTPVGIVGIVEIKLVDGYAVHVYPWANSPGQLAAATGRHARLARYVLTQCQPPGHAGGKPCWITEWGFSNNDSSCPVHEADQVTLIKEMRSAFRQYTREGRLAGLFYYAWIDTREKLGVYRCDALTESGRLAIADLAPLTPAPPQAKVLLARLRNAKLNDRWSTTAPAPPASDSSYQLEATSGYLMTRGDLARHTVELEDCVSQWPGLVCLGGGDPEEGQVRA
jgi:hypothetical protein